jgi:XTP/dITP diphosphohydrolase
MDLRSHTELLVATHNPGKVRELRQLLAGVPLALRGLAEFPGAGTADETGATFAENALLKAETYARRTGLLTLADDSGLEVEALGGRPGVHSARYGGEHTTDAERVALLLRELEAATPRVRSEVPESQGRIEAAESQGEIGLAGSRPRAARFVCVVALYEPRAGAARIFDGACAGRIARAPRGRGGFGYDPIFVPEGHDETFGELPAEVKQRISHRARALSAARDFLQRALAHTP